MKRFGVCFTVVVTRYAVLAIAVALFVVAPCRIAWAGTASGDHKWNLRENSDDRFHDNEPWIRPWRYNYDDGCGRWVGYWSYEVPWGSVSKIGSSDGSFALSKSRDHQFHVWTYVYVESAQTIVLPGGGDCVPRAFLNYAFDSPMTFAPTFSLSSGWNRIDITGYNQNAGYNFTCGGLADLVDVMNSEETHAPDPNAGGSYAANEGTQIDFDASASSDIDGDPLEYRWDFDTDGTYDTGWSSSPSASHTWYDDWTGTATVEVSDGMLAETATAPVTVGNVAPGATIDAIEQPNPRFVLTTHNLTFRGSFTDPGCMDNHTYIWDFGDGMTAEGACDEEHDPPNATGTAVVRYSYSEHGRYSVTLTVMDDDTGSTTVSAAGTIRVLKAKPGTGER